MSNQAKRTMIRKLNDIFTIPLTKDQVALVDEKDWYELRKYKWHAQWDSKTNSYYARRSIYHPEGGNYKNGKLRTTAEQLHRRIMGLKFGDKRQVDHINHNTLDNRRENLRVVTSRENHENRRGQSKYGPGVAYEDRLESKPYKASAYIRGRWKHIGHFSTVKAAQDARNSLVKEIEDEQHS